MNFRINPFLFAGIIAIAACKKKDNIPPSIILNGGDVVISFGTAYADAGATGRDDNDGDISSKILITGMPDGKTAGVFYIKYNVSDAAGNTAEEATRKVTVSFTGVQLSGLYNAYDTCGSANTPLAYAANLLQSGNLYQFQIANMNNVQNSTVFVNVNGNLLSIGPQPLGTGTSPPTVSGNGMVTKYGTQNAIRLYYTITTGTSSSPCRGTYSK